MQSTRRNFLKTGTAGMGAALAGSAAAAAGVAAANDRPNIILILSDDQSVPHVGCYSNPDIRTPNLDRFASQGVRFDRAYVTCPQCMPSRASMMTGRSPVAIQMTRFSAPLPMEIRTYPEVLRANGYYTGVAGRYFHLDGPNGKGFEELYDRLGLRTFSKRLDFVKVSGRREDRAAQFTEFLDQRPKDKPFFLQWCSNDPHRPLDRNAIAQPHDPKKLKLPAHYPDTALVRDDFARYYDEIARFDEDFGQLMKWLDERGLAKNTLVVMMGDNGASQFRGKGTLYEFGINVPLIMRWPGVIKPASSSNELISGEDLAPTFLEAAGAVPPKDMTGKSFLKLLRGQPFEGRRYVFAERGAHGMGLPGTTNDFDLIRCIVSKNHKLVYNALWQLPYTPVDFAGDAFWRELQAMHQEGKLPPLIERLYFSPTRPMFELFDLEKDPSEFNNLFGTKEYETVEQELMGALEEWMIREHDFLPLPQTGLARAPARQRKAERGPGAESPD
jgi:N-sulfoglucosamine sulfohydrolase